MSIILKFGRLSPPLTEPLRRGLRPRVKVAPLSSSDDMDPARGVVTAALFSTAFWVLAIMAFL